MHRTHAEPVLLGFEGGDELPERSGNLSAARQIGDELWLGSDEGTAVERLSAVGPAEYGRHKAFDLAPLLDLPGEDDDEIDIEGLGYSDGRLWVAGSHSATRKAPDLDEGEATGKELRRLGKTKRGGNRFLLGAVPLERPEPGGPLELCRRASDGTRAARLGGGRRRNLLTDALENDSHLAPYLGLPGKDNGFNVEGLVAANGRLFLGLRGPVLRGWAVVLLVAPEPDPDKPDRLRLAPVGGKKRVYRKLFLDLRGLGIRELEPDGDDLLILAGPTMPLDGNAFVLRWPGALRAEQDIIVARDRFEILLELPYGKGDDEGLDHPEGIALMREGDERSLLVVYDSPSPRRRPRPGAVVADRFRLW